MFFDYQQESLVGGIYSFPDFPFSPMPRWTPILESPTITGTNSDTNQSIGASVDNT